MQSIEYFQIPPRSPKLSRPSHTVLPDRSLARARAETLDAADLGYEDTLNVCHACKVLVNDHDCRGPVRTVAR